MSMESLYNNVDRAIAQYEQACEQEAALYSMIQDAENEMSRYNAQASSAEDPSEERAALENMRDAAQRYQQYQEQLQQAQNAKAHALNYLQATRAELTNVINTLEAKIPKVEQSISTFEQMAANPFGASAADQLPKLRVVLADYQQNLNDAYTLAGRIDSVLNGGGSAPQKVLRR